jgi:hypothetical protein
MIAPILAALACEASATPDLSRCRHPLKLTEAAVDLPASLQADLSPWMALHGENWNMTDVRPSGRAQRVVLMGWAGWGDLGRRLPGAVFGLQAYDDRSLRR